MLFFGQRGYRVIAHDRRGHGRSDQTWDGPFIIEVQSSDL
jgi:non-heme chloroperoxidase